MTMAQAAALQTFMARERPILFSAPMVRALLDGRKTQTRRIVKPDAPHWARGCYRRPTQRFVWVTGERPGNGPGDGVALLGDETFACPYGVPGDGLIVRETFRLPAEYDDVKPTQVRRSAPVWYEADGRAAEGWGKTRASIHMPRWASRITLRVTDVRVERLNDISEADALAEGIIEYEADAEDDGDPAEYSIEDDGPVYSCPVNAYRDLWRSINGRGSWGANPWVWCLTFTVQRHG